MSEKFVWFMIGVMALALLVLCGLCMQFPFGILVVIGGIALFGGTIALTLLRPAGKGNSADHREVKHEKPM